MKRLGARLAPVLAAMFVPIVGCTGGKTGYAPKVVARGELTMRYDDGMQIWAGKQLLAKAPEYEGLARYVRCVPRAREHAEQAESDGSTAVGTGWAGGVLGVAGLGGLAGLAFIDEDEVKAYSILGTGVAVGLLGVVLAGFSRNLKNEANGHAVDALNYYNDAVGSRGGTCDDPKPRRAKPPPRALVPRKPPPAPEPPAPGAPAPEPPVPEAPPAEPPAEQGAPGDAPAEPPASEPPAVEPGAAPPAPDAGSSEPSSPPR